MNEKIYSGLKDGDIKVDSKELQYLFKIVGLATDFIPEDLKTQSVWRKRIEYLEYFEKKYFALGELRSNQKKWYTLLKKLEDSDFTKDMTKEEIEKMSRDVWGMYIEAKQQREMLQKEIENIDNRNWFDFVW